MTLANLTEEKKKEGTKTKKSNTKRKNGFHQIIKGTLKHVKKNLNRQMKWRNLVRKYK